MKPLAVGERYASLVTLPFPESWHGGHSWPTERDWHLTEFRHRILFDSGGVATRIPSERQQSFDIRRFQPGDGERGRAVHERAMAETPEYPPAIPDEGLRAIGAHYLDTAGEFLAGVVGETIAAMGAYTTPDEWKGEYVDFDEATAELTRMRVDPGWQGRGFGTAMYRGLRDRARDDGYRRFVPDTGAENDRACGFYEQLGFDRRSEIPAGSGDATVELELYQRAIER